MYDDIEIKETLIDLLAVVDSCLSVINRLLLVFYSMVYFPMLLVRLRIIELLLIGCID